MSVPVDCLDRGPGCTGRAMGGRSRCPACDRGKQRKRNAKPIRRALYGGAWPAQSRAIRAASPWCLICGASRDLTVDHPTLDVLCRMHHGEREAARRAAKSSEGTHPSTRMPGQKHL